MSTTLLDPSNLNTEITLSYREGDTYQKTQKVYANWQLLEAKQEIGSGGIETHITAKAIVRRSKDTDVLNEDWQVIYNGLVYMIVKKRNWESDNYELDLLCIEPAYNPV